MGGAALQCPYSLHRAHIHGGSAAPSAAEPAPAPQRLRASCSDVAFVFGRDFEIEFDCVWGLGREGSSQRVALGSHRWPKHRALDMTLADETEVALPQGSVLLCSGRAFRAAGRGGATLDAGYRAAFLAEAEPQFVANPPAIARHYPPHLQRLGTCKALAQNAACAKVLGIRAARIAAFSAPSQVCDTAFGCSGL